MPTGYTAEIKDGINFKEFILNCAKAFIIECRDGGEVPKKIKVSDYHTKKLKEYRQELAALSKMGVEEADIEAEREHMEEKDRYKKSIGESITLEAKYLDMLKRVRAWIPPTETHQGLKDFMIEQIESSIKFDCGTDYYTKHLASMVELSGKEWLIVKKQKANKNISYHTEEHAKEVERVTQKNNWLKNLHDSI